MVELYKLLNISRTASALQIKTAYRKLALELHPDLNGNDKSKTDKFKSISAAYEVLVDVTRRAEYDRSLTFTSGL